MAVKVTRKRVCDICESEDGVCRYRITLLDDGGQQTVTTDLCAEHGNPVQLALDSSPVPRRGRKPARPVVSLDEINTKKRAGTRKAPASKKAGAPRKRS